MESYYQNLLLKALKATQGKIQISSGALIGQEGLTIPVSQSVPFGNEFGHALTDLEVQATFRKPCSTQALKNLFTTFEGESSYGYKGRLGTYYGIQELSYSDRDTADYATITATNQLTHQTFSWGDDVTAGDMLIVSDLNPVSGTKTGVRRISGGAATVISTYSGLGVSTNQVDASVLRLKPVQLFTVPSPNGAGTEQLFLTVDPNSDAVSNPEYLSNLGLVNEHRVYPLIPPRTGEERADGIFYRISDLKGMGENDLRADEWGFRIILYPSNSGGTSPDLTKPIASLNPVIDSTKPSDEQDMLIDYATGSVYFTTPPRPGDAINPNSYTDGPIKLWAVFAAFSLESETGDSTVHNTARMIMDLPSGADAVYDHPSFLKYNKTKKLWGFYSGKGALKTAAGDQPVQGFEFGDDVATEETVRMILDQVNGRWEICSVPTTSANYQGLFLYSGVNGGQNPGLGFNIGGTEYGLRIDNSTLGWTFDGASFVFNQGASGNIAISIKGDGIAHGMTGHVPTDVFGIITRQHSTEGGLMVAAWSSGTRSLELTGSSTTADTSTSISAAAPIQLSGQKRDTTTIQALADTENVVVMQNFFSSKWILKGNGDQYITGAYANYDSESDALACQDLAYELSGLTDKVIQYNRKKLEKIGVMKNGFIHLNNMLGLQLGAIGEVFQIVEILCDKMGLSYEELRQMIRGQEM